MRLVIALGGNALLRRGEQPTAVQQRRHLEAATAGLAGICARHQTVITHGNGPQIGLRAAAASGEAGEALDLLGAESEGLIGYQIERSLRNRMPDAKLATLLTQVVVSAADPAFARPTKPIGLGYDRAVADRLRRRRGWRFVADGQLFRRVVASPEPQRIVEIDAIRCLVAAGFLVICAGGGGIPVIEDRRGRLRGASAVVDKDLAAACLAIALEADGLLLLTDVDAVHAGWGTPEARPIRRADPARLRQVQFEPGSMGPKVEAACRFVTATGRAARIGHLDQARRVLAGTAGTLVSPDAGFSLRT